MAQQQCAGWAESSREATPANVNATNFGKLFQINVDGKVDAQPLIVTSVTIPNQGVHNLLIIATEHDTVTIR